MLGLLGLPRGEHSAPRHVQSLADLRFAFNVYSYGQLLDADHADVLYMKYFCVLPSSLTPLCCSRW